MHTAVPNTSPYEIGQESVHAIRRSFHNPGTQINTPRGPYSAKTALYMAASLTDGAARDVILREADAKEVNSRRPGRAREAANLRMWSFNPANTDLREVGPQTILKNIFGLEHVNNPAAEIFYSMLALWRYCPTENTGDVLRYFERAAKDAMKYKDKEFVEFFRRVLDFPRRGLLNAQDPNFMEVINDTVAVAAGAKIYLPPETFLTLRRPVISKATQPKYPSARIQAYDQPRFRRGRTNSGKTMLNAPSRGETTQFNSVQTAKSTTSTQPGTLKMLLPELIPLDGTAKDYANGPFIDPKGKLEEKDCCFCWNYGHGCKLLNENGRCQKLHICMHKDCRTLYHHGHRITDHRPARG